MRHDIIREQKAIWFLEEESTLHSSCCVLVGPCMSILHCYIPLQIMPIGGNSAALKRLRSFDRAAQS